MTVGERIKEARKTAGLTQKELGERLGVSFQAVAQWENNLRNPKIDTLQKIASALNVSVDSLGVIDVAADLLSDYATALQQKNAIEILGQAIGLENIERIVIALDLLNDEGKTKAVERVEELAEIPKYQKGIQKSGGE